jgi:hypothetical protein
MMLFKLPDHPSTTGAKTMAKNLGHDHARHVSAERGYAFE